MKRRPNKISDRLEQKLENVPQKPGVYLFKDSSAKVIYIGKAKILRNRVRSYFQQGRIEGPKFLRLVSRIHDFETIVTDSEVEALILEANLIREHKPRYNINLKDDKSFPFIRITNELFPRIFPTRRLIRDGSQYFGPYTDVKSMRALLKTVKRIFPIRSCNYNLSAQTIKDHKYKLCLDYHIKRCLGPCEGLISQQEYAEIVDYVRDFLAGKGQKLITDLKKRMTQLSEQLRFEDAARLRDQLDSLNEFQQHQKVVDMELSDRDIIAIATEDNDSCSVVFKVREGKMLGRQHFYMEGTEDETIEDVTGAFVKQYYMRSDYIPTEVFLPCRIPDVESLQIWLGQKRGAKVRIHVPQRGEKAKLLELCDKNAKLLLEELKLQRMKTEDYVHSSVQALQKELNLPNPPKRIEAFDVSNISGTSATASMVTFVNGQPRKSDYRLFNIRSKSTPDDFTMMAEAITRRYKRLLKEKKELPDLILVDGGKGQLSVALSSLHELGLDNLSVIALAKRLDEVFVPNISEPQNIRKDSAGLRLLQKIRDEAHRFAITQHRKLRKRRTLKSALENIEQVGKKRREKLLQYFGSLKRIKEASAEEISKVQGISPKLARQIWEYFHQGNSLD